jgi:hypothetical protein
MAFILPCFAIVLCYARIFYIVRKTAMKTHEIPTKINGSIRHVTPRKTPSPLPQTANKIENQMQLRANRPSIEIDDYNDRVDENKNDENGNNENRRKILSKTKNEDLKFIDTSCESDLPPSLSQLQRKSVHISSENVMLPIIIRTEPSSPITSLANENVQLNLIDEKPSANCVDCVDVNNDVDDDEKQHHSSVGTNVQNKKNAHPDLGVDSAVEDSTISLEQVNMKYRVIN